RLLKPRQPEAYLRDPAELSVNPVPSRSLPFEFMLNALRLTDGVNASLFTERTGLPPECIAPELQLARERGLLEPDPEILRPTAHGLRFLNDLLEMFLEDDDSTN
ncbi:hypothetical protein V6O07_09600, partial [Arthrospira platensis SPKY2]